MRLATVSFQFPDAAIGAEYYYRLLRSGVLKYAPGSLRVSKLALFQLEEVNSNNNKLLALWDSTIIFPFSVRKFRVKIRPSSIIRWGSCRNCENWSISAKITPIT